MQMLNVVLYLAKRQDTVFMEIFVVNCTAIKPIRNAQLIPCPLPRAQSVAFSQRVMEPLHRAGATR